MRIVDAGLEAGEVLAADARLLGQRGLCEAFPLPELLQLHGESLRRHSNRVSYSLQWVSGTRA